MELRHLRYFLAVADLTSFTRAAAALRITQPALSRQVRDLEYEVGVPLLRRHKRGTSLTRAGVLFAQKARGIVEAADQAIAEARHAGRQIRFGHYGTLWLDYFAPALRKYAKDFPGLPLVPVELTPTELARGVRKGEIDFALLGPFGPSNDPELEVRQVAAVPAVVVMSAANAFGKRRRLNLSDLREAEWLRWDEGAFPSRNSLLEEAAAAAGFVPRWGARADSIGSIFLQVSSSSAVALVLPMSRRMAISGIVFTELRGAPVRFPMDVAWLSGHPFSKELEKLARCLASEKAKVGPTETRRAYRPRPE